MAGLHTDLPRIPHHHVVVRLTLAGCARVLNGHEGMTFPVHAWGGADGATAHVRDHRYPDEGRDFQIWSIGREGYEVV